MMKKLLFILTSLFIGINCLQATELVIELKTDQYPGETSWALYDYDWNIVKKNGTLTENKTHFDTIQIDSEKCYIWKIFDRHGDGLSYAGSEGDFNIYLDGNLVYECLDPNFGDSIAVYGLGVACSKTDISVDAFAFADVQSYTPFNFGFQLFNFGPDTVTSVACTYELEGVVSDTILIEDIQVAMGELGLVTLPKKVEFTQAGLTQVSLTVVKVNNQSDGFASNNSVKKDVEVKEGYWKEPLHQVFTSSTCGPCRPGNANLDGILEEYSAENYTLIKYQVNWPGSGDPYFTSEVGQMKNLYSVSAVPTMYVNKTSISPGIYSSDDMDTFLAELSDLEIELNGEVVGDSAFASGKIKALTNKPSGLSMRIALVEKTTYDNASTNGETEFHNVFMKFLTPWRGVELDAIHEGGALDFTFGEDISETFIEEKSDLRLVAYVFETGTFTIVQSQMVDIPFTRTAPNISFSIENNATEIDTMPNIEIYSSRTLLNTDSTEISDLSTIVLFTETETGYSVDYVSSIGDDSQMFIIQPKSVLKSGTSYTITVNNAISDEFEPINETTLNFTTIKVVGVNFSELNTLRVYPNPAYSILNIESKQNVNAVIIDISGKEIMSINLVKGRNSMNISALNQGLYFIKSADEKQMQVVRFVKTN